MFVSGNKHVYHRLSIRLSPGINTFALYLVSDWCCTCIYIYAYLFLTRSYSGHEEAIGQLAKEMGFSHVSLSSHVMPMIRMVPRGYTGKEGIMFGTPFVAAVTRLHVWFSLFI